MITHLKLTDPADGLQVLLPLGNGYYFVSETADGAAKFFTNPHPCDRELIGSYVSFAQVAQEMAGAGLVLEVETDAQTPAQIERAKKLTYTRYPGCLFDDVPLSDVLTAAGFPIRAGDEARPTPDHAKFHQGRDLGAELLSDRMTSGDAHVDALKKTIQRLDDEKASMDIEVKAYRSMQLIVMTLEAEGLKTGLKIEDALVELANLWIAQKVEIKRLEQKERELNQRLSHTDVGRSADIIERLKLRVEDEASQAELLRKKVEQLSVENQETAYRLNAPSRGEPIK